MSDVVFTEMGNAGRKSSVVCFFFAGGGDKGRTLMSFNLNELSLRCL